MNKPFGSSSGQLSVARIDTRGILISPRFSLHRPTQPSFFRHIVPVLCLSVDFYVRIFVRVYTSAEEVKRSCLYVSPSPPSLSLTTLTPLSFPKFSRKMSHVYECTGCLALHFQPLGGCSNRDAPNAKFFAPKGPPVGQTCEECGKPFRV